MNPHADSSGVFHHGLRGVAEQPRRGVSNRRVDSHAARAERDRPASVLSGGLGDLPDRIAAKIAVDTATGCWNWTGKIHSRGYGHVSFASKHYHVHRVTYEMLVGPCPEGLDPDHLCRNIACCNPAHLEWVTHRENVLRGDSPAARNARKTHCLRGHEFTDENTSRKPNGGRSCRACRRMRRQSKREAIS